MKASKFSVAKTALTSNKKEIVMTIKKNFSKYFLFSFLLSLCFINQSYSAVLFQDDFNYTDSFSNHGWGEVSAQSSIASNSGPDGSNALKISFSADQVNRQHNWKVPANTQELFIKYNFKMDCGSGKCVGGAKFLKLFGIRNGTNYANTTTAMIYQTSILAGLSYGASGDTRDTDTLLNYNGSINPMDGKWHTWEVHMKYNDNGQNNGIYEVWYDGTKVLGTTGVNNRSDNNSKYFDYIQLGGWNQYYGGIPYNILYDKLVISTTRTTTTGGTTLSAPSNLRIAIN